MWHFWHKIQENFPGDKQNISQQIRVSLFCFVSFCNIKSVKAIKSFEMYMYLKMKKGRDEKNEMQQPKGNVPFADHMWGLNYANWIIYIIQTTRENNKNAFQFFSVWLINAQYFTTLCDFIFRVHDKSHYDMDLTTTSGTSNLMYVHCLMIIPSENQDAQLFFLCHLFSCHFLVSACGHIVMVPPDLQVQHLPTCCFSLLSVSVGVTGN